MHRAWSWIFNPERPERPPVHPPRPGTPTTGGIRRSAGTCGGAFTDNLNLNGTVKPDFSQVESDAGQLAFDPRQALFFSEKRPVLPRGQRAVSGAAEPHSTPAALLQPVAAVKLNGQRRRHRHIGFLSAVDQKFASASGADNPIFNILRAQRSLGHGSRIGMAYTDRIEGGNYNRVAEVDSRLVFKDIYGLNLQLAGSRTRTGGINDDRAAVARAVHDSASHLGIAQRVRRHLGRFSLGERVHRSAGIVHSYVDPSYTTYGKPGALLQRFTGDLVVDGNLAVSELHPRPAHPGTRSCTSTATRRCGAAGTSAAGISWESFGYDSALYASYRLEVPKSGGGLDTIPFGGQPTIGNGEYIIQIGTPQWKAFQRRRLSSSRAMTRISSSGVGRLAAAQRRRVVPPDGPAAQLVQLFLAAGESPYRRQPGECRTRGTVEDRVSALAAVVHQAGGPVHPG